MANVPAFRYLSEYKEYIDNIGETINVLVHQVDHQKKLLASFSNEASIAKSLPIPTYMKATVFDLRTDEGKLSTRKVNQTINKEEFARVKIPNMQALEKKYELLERLYEQHRLLTSVDARIRVQFTGKPSEALRTEVTELKGKVERALRATFQYLHDLASHHVPKEFQKYMDVLSEEVDAHIASEKTTTFLYVSVYKKSLVFTYYKMLERVINEDGNITPVMYVGVQWVVGSDEIPQTMLVYLNYEYETPSTLLAQGGGIEVTSVASAVKALSHLFTIEQFSSELGVVPLSIAFLRDPKLIDKRNFHSRDLIEKLDIQPNEITFQIKKSVPKELYPELSKQLYIDTYEMIRQRKGSRLRMNPQPTKRRITFNIVQTSNSSSIDLNDVEYMVDRFGISQSQLRKIVQIINSNPGM